MIWEVGVRRPCIQYGAGSFYDRMGDCQRRINAEVTTTKCMAGCSLTGTW